MKKNMNCFQKILIPLTALALSIPAGASAGDNIVVRGRIYNDATGSAQAGAHVTYVGTDVAAMSSEDGTFTLKTSALSGTLLVEAPGFDMQIVPLQGRNDINIRLTPSSAGESFYDARLLSSASSRVQTEKGQLRATADVSPDLQLMGVRSTQRSGVDAGGASTLIRGIKSINMSTEPLFIVDGIEWSRQDNYTSLLDGYASNPLALLSPDDIESIQILRNGTAIYGSKAAGGVVLITTKRARTQATEITLNASIGVKSPFRTMPMMNASDYRVYATDVMRGLNGGKVAAYDFLDDNTGSSTYAATHNNTDWLSEVNKMALVQNYDLGVRGGDDKALYAFSLGYAKSDGNVDRTSFQRLFVRFNSDIKLTKRLTTRADISFAQVSRNIFDDGINTYSSPLYLAYVKSPRYSPWQYDNQGNRFNSLADKDELSVGNPLAITTNAEGNVKNYRFTSLLEPTYRFSDKFSLSARAVFSWDKVKEGQFIPDFGTDERIFVNSQGDYYGEGDNKVGTLMTRHSNLLLGIKADYSPLRGDHSLDLHLGWHYQTDVFTNSFGVGYNTGSDNLKSLSVTNSALRSNGSLHNDWHEVSAWLTADYNYLNRYYLSAQVGMESDSRFGKEVESAPRLGGVSWMVAPSVTAAWVLTGEQWMRGLPWVNYLRLHATWETAGNNDLPFNATRTYFTSIRYAGLARGLQLANSGNDKLQWETTRTASIGLDARLLGNRLSLSGEVYVANTSNLLLQKQLPEEFGLSTYYTNDGKLRNSGFDVSLQARLVDNASWKLGANATIGHYKNEVQSLGSGAFTTSVAGGTVLTTTGQPVGVFYGYRSRGVFSTRAEAEAANLAIVTDNGELRHFAAGDMHYEDADGNGIINDADRQVIGNPNPDIYGSFGLNLQYRRLTLSTTFTYSLGNDVYNALRASLESGSSLCNQTTNMRQRWTADGQVTTVPRATYGDPMGNAAFSDRWIEDGSFLKMRQLSLSYDLPIKPKVIQSLQLWAAVNNLFTVTKYTGSDPEFSYGSSSLCQGIDAGLTPPTRSYFFGVKLGL